MYILYIDYDSSNFLDLKHYCGLHIILTLILPQIDCLTSYSLTSANTARRPYELCLQQLPESYVSSSGSYRYPLQSPITHQASLLGPAAGLLLARVMEFCLNCGLKSRPIGVSEDLVPICLVDK